MGIADGEERDSGNTAKPRRLRSGFSLPHAHGPKENSRLLAAVLFWIWYRVLVEYPAGWVKGKDWASR